MKKLGQDLRSLNINKYDQTLQYFNSLDTEQSKIIEQAELFVSSYTIYRVSQKTWEFGDEFDIGFVIN